MLRSTRQRFGSIAILFHWGIALGVVVLYALGLYLDELGYQDPWFNRAMDLHKGLGMLLFAAILARWLWRRVDVQPVPLETYSAFEQWSARMMKAVLYLLLVLVPLSGYLISSAEGQPIDVFGWFQVAVEHLTFFPEIEQLVVAEDLELVFQGEGILVGKESCHELLLRRWW